MLYHGQQHALLYRLLGCVQDCKQGSNPDGEGVYELPSVIQHYTADMNRQHM